MKSGKDEEIVPREPEKDIIDKALQYGKYQSLLIWIFGTSIGTNHRSLVTFFLTIFKTFPAFIGAIDYIQLVFMLNDRQEWSCLEPHREMCNETLEGIESICGGGEVVFNTSHPNFLHSLVVEHKWICKEVSGKFLPC